VNKGKMEYKFIDDGSVKEFSALSSGEQTRVSLLLLLATLKSIEQLLGMQINFLVFDELFGVLDDEGIHFIDNVLTELRKEKAVFVVNHHDELDMIIPDYEIRVIKENNVSWVEVSE
jgi:DNA repair exonuclease SbcCD ATPase subunit